MDTRSTGILIIGLGLVLVLIGLVVLAGGLPWFGRLPGEIHCERVGIWIYIPITTMIVVSIVLTIQLAAVRRLSS